MDITKIEASPRTDSGKGPAARLRREGKIPAVAYGKGMKTLSVAISPKALLTALKSAHGKNSVIELDVTGQSKLTVLVRDYTYHPVSRDLTHADFVQVKLDEEVDVEVPFHTVGKAVGITSGGTLRIVFRKLPIRCLPERIPVKIEHDITNVGLNEVVKISQIVMPEGVKARLPDEQTIASIIAPEKERAEDAAATPAAGAAGGKKDEKAAPAKDAKKKLSRPWTAPVARPLVARWRALFRAWRPPRRTAGRGERWRADSAGNHMLLIVGLGNPGKEYADTRHNLGFLAVDALASRARAEAFREKFSGEYARVRLGDEDAVLLKPQTYMNLSGQCVQPAAAFFKVEPGSVVVAHDELDLPFGEVRVKRGGGHAGHNGLRSLIERLGTPDFVRVRLGIGRPPAGFKGDTAAYVLGRFDPVERAQVPDVCARALVVFDDIARLGVSAAMNRHNTKPAAPKPAARPAAAKPAATGPAETGPVAPPKAPGPPKG
jgi:aminoacyl-tRNA hydrolase/ribosomal protein bL25 (Ctc-form)